MAAGRMRSRGSSREPYAETEFTAGLNNNSSPDLITTGPDNALWFVERSTGRLGRITTAGAISYRSLGAPVDCSGRRAAELALVRAGRRVSDGWMIRR